MKRTLRYVFWTAVGYVAFVGVLNTALEIGEQRECGDVAFPT